MCISRIDHQEKADVLIKNYEKWQNRFGTMQFIPVIGLIGGIGMFAFDAKTLFINKLFVEKAYRAQIAANTYDDPGTGKTASARSFRLFAVISILTCGFAGFSYFLIRLFLQCICPSSSRA